MLCAILAEREDLSLVSASKPRCPPPSDDASEPLSLSQTWFCTPLLDLQPIAKGVHGNCENMTSHAKGTWQV